MMRTVQVTCVLTHLIKGVPSPPIMIEATPTGEVEGTLLLGTAGVGRVSNVIFRCWTSRT